MSDPTAPPPGGEQYPPAGGYPPPASPGGYPPPQEPAGGYPPPETPGGYPPPAQAYQQPQAYGQPGYGAPAGAPSPYVTLMNGQTVKVADFGQRAVARIIDAVIVGVVNGILYAIFLGIFFGTAETTIDPDTGQLETTGGAGLVGIWLLIVGLLVVLGILYEVIFVAIKGQTPGKMIMGAKVVNEASGELVGWGPAFLRWLVPAGAGWITCGVGTLLVYLSPLFDKSGRFQGWHDKVAKDLVISLK